MNNEKVKALAVDRSMVIYWLRFALLVGVATMAPLFHQQMITGPMVNATLFVSSIFLGVWGGILVGLIPSIIALMFGTLPAPLAIMVAYIMVSNVILIVTFSRLRNRSFWLAIGVASFLKFLFLYLSSLIILGWLMKNEVNNNLAIMMSYPQLLTALAGGVLARWFFGNNKNNI